MTETDKAWAAGFLDGEAYIGVTRAFYGKRREKYFHRVCISVAQVKKTPLEKLQSMFGGRVTQMRGPCGLHWVWVLTAWPASIVLCVLQPYFVAKRAQVELCLELQDTVTAKGRTPGSGHRPFLSDEVYARRCAIHAALMELNKRRQRLSQAERLSEKAPQSADDATVRTHGNKNRERQKETSARLKLVEPQVS
jgi:hypothetical protein